MCVCRSHFHRSTNVPSSPASTWTWLIRSLQPVCLFQFAPPSCAKEPNIQFWTPENGFCQGIWFDFKEELWLITFLLFMIFQYIWHWLELVNWMRSGWFHFQWNPHRPFQRFSSIGLQHNDKVKGWRAVTGSFEPILFQFDAWCPNRAKWLLNI